MARTNLRYWLSFQLQKLIIVKTIEIHIAFNLVCQFHRKKTFVTILLQYLVPEIFTEIRGFNLTVFIKI